MSQPEIQPQGPKQIHGHEVLNMMLEAGRAFTTEELIRAIHERFGTTARFHTCSAEDLDAVGLVEFLARRGKFVPAEAADSFKADASRMCAG